MKIILTSIRLTILLPVLLSCIIIVGCERRTTPPGPDAVFGVITDTSIHFQLLKWEEGLSILFIDRMSQHKTSGHGSTSNPVYREAGSAGNEGGHGYDWEILTTDGKTADIRINDTAYNVGEGSVFVVQLNGEQINIHQLELDLSKLKSNGNDCQSFLKDNPNVIQLVGVKPGK